MHQNPRKNETQEYKIEADLIFFARRFYTAYDEKRGKLLTRTSMSSPKGKEC